MWIQAKCRICIPLVSYFIYVFISTVWTWCVFCYWMGIKLPYHQLATLAFVEKGNICYVLSNQKDRTNSLVPRHSHSTELSRISSELAYSELFLCPPSFSLLFLLLGFHLHFPPSFFYSPRGQVEVSWRRLRLLWLPFFFSLPSLFPPTYTAYKTPSMDKILKISANCLFVHHLSKVDTKSGSQFPTSSNFFLSSRSRASNLFLLIFSSFRSFLCQLAKGLFNQNSTEWERNILWPQNIWCSIRYTI